MLVQGFELTTTQLKQIRTQKKSSPDPCQCCMSGNKTELHHKTIAAAGMARIDSMEGSCNIAYMTAESQCYLNIPSTAAELEEGQSIHGEIEIELRHALRHRHYRSISFNRRAIRLGFSPSIPMSCVSRSAVSIWMLVHSTLQSRPSPEMFVCSPSLLQASSPPTDA